MSGKLPSSSIDIAGIATAMRDAADDQVRCVESVRSQLGVLAAVAGRLIETFQRGGRLFILGNGGSAADAQHIAAELVGRFKRDRPGLPAMALTTDSSCLTAISNDIGFENVFARQIEAWVRPGDAVWALSVSGRSPNVLAAMRRARDLGALRIGFTGRGGGALAELCDLTFQVNHQASDRVQEMHQLAYHLVCGAVEAAAAGEAGGRS